VAHVGAGLAFFTSCLLGAHYHLARMGICTTQKWAAIDCVQTDIIIKCAMHVGHEQPCTSTFLSHAHWPRASWRRTQKSTTACSTIITFSVKASSLACCHAMHCVMRCQMHVWESLRAKKAVEGLHCLPPPAPRS